MFLLNLKRNCPLQGTLFYWGDIFLHGLRSSFSIFIWEKNHFYLLQNYLVVGSVLTKDMWALQFFWENKETLRFIEILHLVLTGQVLCRVLRSTIDSLTVQFRDSKGISELTWMWLILPCKICCIRVILGISLLSLPRIYLY